MKKLFLLCLFTGTTLLSCQKNTANPITTVTINGNSYTTATIGTQTWTTVNYNGTGGVTYNSAVDNSTNGKLYTITEAKAISLPTGWRVPTQSDYAKLLSFEGATGIDTVWATQIVPVALASKLMSTTGWSSGNGTNTSGFNAYPVGCMHNGSFQYAGTDAVFLTTSSLYQGTQLGSANAAACFHIFVPPATINNASTSALLDDAVSNYTTDRASLRFVKDN